jgi:hypothetical protein
MGGVFKIGKSNYSLPGASMEKKIILSLFLKVGWDAM